jgi:hypothetical protein
MDCLGTSDIELSICVASRKASCSDTFDTYPVRRDMRVDLHPPACVIAAESALTQFRLFVDIDMGE